MVQLTAMMVREITQRHKYRWHVTTENAIFDMLHDCKDYYNNVSVKRCLNLFAKY